MENYCNKTVHIFRFIVINLRFNNLFVSRFPYHSQLAFATRSRQQFKSNWREWQSRTQNSARAATFLVYFLSRLRLEPCLVIMSYFFGSVAHHSRRAVGGHIHHPHDDLHTMYSDVQYTSAVVRSESISSSSSFLLFVLSFCFLVPIRLVASQSPSKRNDVCQESRPRFPRSQSLICSRKAFDARSLLFTTRSLICDGLHAGLLGVAVIIVVGLLESDLKLDLLGHNGEVSIWSAVVRGRGRAGRAGRPVRRRTHLYHAVIPIAVLLECVENLLGVGVHEVRPRLPQRMDDVVDEADLDESKGSFKF